MIVDAAERIAAINAEMLALVELASAEIRDLTAAEQARQRELLAEAAALGHPTAMQSIHRLRALEVDLLVDRDLSLLLADAAGWILADDADGLGMAVLDLSPVERDAAISVLVLLCQDALSGPEGETGRRYLARQIALHRCLADEVPSQE